MLVSINSCAKPPAMPERIEKAMPVVFKKMLLSYKGNSAVSVTKIQKEQNNEKSLAHTVWECKYHIVWCPKNRRKVIYGKLKRDIGQILRKLCEYKGVEVLEGTACADHIHVFLSIPPKYFVLGHFFVLHPI